MNSVVGGDDGRDGRIGGLDWMLPRTEYFAYYYVGYVDVTLLVSTYPTCRVLGQMQTGIRIRIRRTILHVDTCCERNMHTNKKKKKRKIQRLNKKPAVPVIYAHILHTHYIACMYVLLKMPCKNTNSDRDRCASWLARLA